MASYRNKDRKHTARNLLDKKSKIVLGIIVVYFDHILSAAHTQKPGKILFFIFSGGIGNFSVRPSCGLLLVQDCIDFSSRPFLSIISDFWGKGVNTFENKKKCLKTHTKNWSSF